MHSGAGRELVRDLSWTPAAISVFERACEHYGGFETWRALRRVRLIPERLSGLVPVLKGVGRTFALPAAFEIEPHERRALFLSYPDADHDGVFENGAVRLQRRDGSTVQSSADHRASERHVEARLGKIALPVTALHATFLGAEVELRDGVRACNPA